jgi:hypothetical protein
MIVREGRPEDVTMVFVLATITLVEGDCGRAWGRRIDIIATVRKARRRVTAAPWENPPSWDEENEWYSLKCCPGDPQTSHDACADSPRGLLYLDVHLQFEAMNFHRLTYPAGI